MYVRQEGSKGDISILHLEVLVRTIVSPFCLIRQGREETPFIPEERRKKKDLSILLKNFSLPHQCRYFFFFFSPNTFSSCVSHPQNGREK